MKETHKSREIFPEQVALELGSEVGLASNHKREEGSMF
jgi:hypothetical protein